MKNNLMTMPIAELYPMLGVDEKKNELILKALRERGEDQLPDDYPVIPGHSYVSGRSGRRLESPLYGTVADLKREWKVPHVHRCALASRGLEDK